MTFRAGSVVVPVGIDERWLVMGVRRRALGAVELAIGGWPSPTVIEADRVRVAAEEPWTLAELDAVFGADWRDRRAAGWGPDFVDELPGG